MLRPPQPTRSPTHQVDALVRAIAGFKGGLLVVSHDQHLLSTVCSELWVVRDGKVGPLKGTFEDYKRKVVGRMAK